MAAARAFCADRDQASLVVNLDPSLYWALLRDAGALVGNSSSGIMETPSLGLPTVNVGRRQDGRTRAPNVFDVPARTEDILRGINNALDPATRARFAGLSNPYGDGRTGERIAASLAALPGRERLLAKQALPVSADGPPCFRHG
jgi:UDP-N-acetylglucosamine 2-epimerase